MITDDVRSLFEAITDSAVLLDKAGRIVDWNQGDAVHVPPGMLHHQHFNPYDKDMKELRFEFGVRYWFVDQWKGYVTVDKHLKATTHMVD